VLCPLLVNLEINIFWVVVVGDTLNGSYELYAANARPLLKTDCELKFISCSICLKNLQLEIGETSKTLGLISGYHIGSTAC